VLGRSAPPLPNLRPFRAVLLHHDRGHDPQALWQAVMSTNPSRFIGDDRRPVERVSWHDAQAFLRRIAALRPGLDLSLPSEAEWEYACRAGTITPFSFGTEITPDQVNYNYVTRNTDRKKSPSKRTAPVGSLPANPWGLHEMHGNVSEWCADGRRSYDATPQIDPRGPESVEHTHRAMRGGSWGSGARSVRSTYRREAPRKLCQNVGAFACA
jgi:formylglycine-generating enzyme required for sulfatase activity